MNELSHLVAIEQIKQLKAQYFYLVDHKEWAVWAEEVWAPDAELHVPDFREQPFRGAAQIADWSSAMLADCISIHHGFTPLIEILTERDATGIWAMEDIILRKTRPAKDGPSFIHGWGHYHERYVCTERGWRIASSRLTRVHMETRA